MIIIYTVCKNKTEAKKIATMLLKLKLIVCANWWQTDSAYSWQGKLVQGKECILVLKTRKNYYKKIEALIKKLHSYDTPCILRLEPAEVEASYKAWLMKSTKFL